MSDWFNVLKMPANIDIQATRDSDYTKVIVEYEKSHIAPYFDDYLKQGDALFLGEIQRQYNSAGWETENLGDTLVINTPEDK